MTLPDVWTHPFWLWLAAAAALLAVEVAIGSGYLLWACGAAAAVAVLALLVPQSGLVVQALLFAGLAVASTTVSRRLWPPRREPSGPDINAIASRLVGLTGKVTVADAAAHRARVLVDGKEWAADAETGAAPLATGAQVEVLAVLGGSRLRVRPV